MLIFFVKDDLDFLMFAALHYDQVAFVSCAALLAPAAILSKNHNLSALVKIIPESEFNKVEVFFSSSQQLAKVDTPLSFKKMKRTPATDSSGATDDELFTVQKQPAVKVPVSANIPKKSKLSEKKTDMNSLGIAIQMTPPNEVERNEKAFENASPSNSSVSTLNSKKKIEKDIPIMSSPTNDINTSDLPSSFFCVRKLHKRNVYKTCEIPGIDEERYPAQVNSFLTVHPLVNQDDGRHPRDSKHEDSEKIPQNELHK
jgi:hypothetical protein